MLEIFLRAGVIITRDIVQDSFGTDWRNFISNSVTDTAHDTHDTHTESTDEEGTNQYPVLTDKNQNLKIIIRQINSIISLCLVVLN